MTRSETLELRVLTLNIGAPSAARAERQLEWLADRDEHVHVLTEISGGSGSELIAKGFHQAGWDVRSRPSTANERGVLLASRIRLSPRGDDLVDFLPHRALVATVPAGPTIIGVYVPSRDDSPASVERKQQFLTSLTGALGDRGADRPAVLVGDLNILEPTHRPHYGLFRDWEYGFYDDLTRAGWLDAYRLRHPSAMEYSWVGADDDGYRFDHALVSASLGGHVTRCDYTHDTRALGLSDHSAMTLTVNGTAVEPLEVAASLSTGPASLF